MIIKETEALPWKVIHLPYPREKQEYTAPRLQWVRHGKIKLPKIYMQRKTLEKRDATVNYDLLCQELESLLAEQDRQGYEVFSIIPSHSGQFSTLKVPNSPSHPFLGSRRPSSLIQGKEALIIVLQQKRTREA